MSFFRLSNIVRIYRLLTEAFGAYKWYIVVVGILSVLVGIAEGIGINAIIPLFSFVGGQEHVPSDSISRAIQSLFAFTHITYSVTSLLIFIGSLFIAKAIFIFVSRYINLWILSVYEYRERKELFSALLQSQWKHLAEQKVGFVDQVILQDIARSAGIPFHIGSLMRVCVSILVYSFLVVNISLPIALIAFLSGLGMLLLIKPLFASYRLFSDKIVKRYKQLGHFINEHIVGMKVIKANAVESGVVEKGESVFGGLQRLRVRSEVTRIISDVLLEPIGIVFVLGVFAYLFKVGTFNFPSFAVLVYAVSRVFNNIQQFQSEVHDLNSRAPNLSALSSYKRKAREERERQKGERPFTFTKSLDISGVSFSHEGGVRILSDISFSVSRGEVFGIIGPSGSGKTTLVDIILRLLTPTIGALQLDGVKSDDVNLRKWRENIGYVPQESFLINDTIEENIRFYGNASSEDIAEAARQAHIFDFIAKLPEGFKTMVGERGNRLSGGERQRIALARALVRKPQILILDEATSALDNESESLIQKSIDALRGSLTIMVIAHRLSTVLTADRVVAMERGRIAEIGKPAELLKNPESYFSRMYKLTGTA
ncbi:MAG: ABC transporter ATP-binding protein [bacterium]|nr:ABC transporter ATP-binding protein [bacterium]